MTPSANMFAIRSTEADATFTGTIEIVPAPGVGGTIIIRSLIVSSDTAFTAALKSATTRKGPKLFCAANGGAALSDMALKLSANEAFNIAFTGGGNGSYYCEYQITGL